MIWYYEWHLTNHYQMMGWVKCPYCNGRIPGGVVALWVFPGRFIAIPYYVHEDCAGYYVDDKEKEGVTFIYNEREADVLLPVRQPALHKAAPV